VDKGRSWSYRNQENTMPSIKDQSTVQAIAREFIDNGRNKTQAMITIGYDPVYADSGCGQKSVYGNIRTIDAIKAIDEQSRVDLGVTIASQQAEHQRLAALAESKGDLATATRLSLIHI